MTYAFLLERTKEDGTVYSPAQYFCGAADYWNTDHAQAVRFAREQDAKKLFTMLEDVLPVFIKYKGWKAIGHTWIEE